VRRELVGGEAAEHREHAVVARHRVEPERPRGRPEAGRSGVATPQVADDDEPPRHPVELAQQAHEVVPLEVVEHLRRGHDVDAGVGEREREGVGAHARVGGGAARRGEREAELHAHGREAHAAPRGEPPGVQRDVAQPGPDVDERARRAAGPSAGSRAPSTARRPPNSAFERATSPSDRTITSGVIAGSSMCSAPRRRAGVSTRRPPRGRARRAARAVPSPPRSPFQRRVAAAVVEERARGVVRPGLVHGADDDRVVAPRVAER
jgi:hypothetical protein